MRIDLHTHSTASDGTDTPGQLIERAVAEGLDVIAITDHDTTAGWDDAASVASAATTTGGAAGGNGITLIQGAEFSCVHVTDNDRRISMHVLGYLFDPDHPELRAERARLRDSRQVRARRIVERLNADGYDLDWDAVSALAPGAAIGRPHIARALVSAGAAADVDLAFRDFLSSRQRYYEPKQDTPVLEMVTLIRAAGGLPVFAHPLARRRGPVVDATVVAAMAEVGLVGMEVDHPDHDDADRAEAAALAQALDLIPTGASDFHGSNKSTGLGIRTTSVESYERLLALPSARAPITA